MNKKVQALVVETNTTTTEKGDVAYKSTLNANLDLFTNFDLGQDVENFNTNQEVLLDKAFSEDKELAIKNLLYKIDVRGGKSENAFAKYSIVYLFTKQKEVFKKLFFDLINLTRWDRIVNQISILVEIDKKLASWVKNVVKAFIFTPNNLTKQFPQINIKNKTYQYSLANLFKWLPSINTSNKESRKNAQIWAETFCVKKENKKTQEIWANYRKWLSKKRQEYQPFLLERDLTNKNYKHIQLDKLPKKALITKTEKLLEKLTVKQWEKFLTKIKQDPKSYKINTIQPHYLVSKILNTDNTKLLNTFSTLFNNINIDLQTTFLPVIDSSGSMEQKLPNSVATVLDVAYTIGLITAKQNKGEYKNVVLRFSKETDVVALDEKSSLKAQLNQMYNGYVGTTNIESVYQTFYNIAKKDKANVPKGILIVSDMQFDGAVDIKTEDNKSTSVYKELQEKRKQKTEGIQRIMDIYKKKFESIKVDFPTIIFWNIASYSTKPVTAFENNVIMISGFSNGVYKSLNNIEELIKLANSKEKTEKPEINSVTVMLDVLKKYDTYLNKVKDIIK